MPPGRTIRTRIAPLALAVAVSVPLAFALGARPAAAQQGPVAAASTSASSSSSSSSSAGPSASVTTSASSSSASTPIGASTTSVAPASSTTPPVDIDTSTATTAASDASTDEEKLGLHYEIESIRIRGNKRTNSRVILRYVPFRMGDELDLDDARLELIRFRLLGTGYFSDVQISLSKGGRRGSVVLNIDVVERNTLVINDIWLGLSSDATPNGTTRPLTAYGGADVAENNFFGTGISIGAAVAVADRQQGYRLRFADPSFLGSKWIVSTTLIYNNARDFFGTRDVLFDPPPGESPNTDYAIATYTRKGGEVAAGIDLSTSARLFGGYHLEVIDSSLPLAASDRRGLDVEPIAFHLIEGRSLLSYLTLRIDDDTRDDPILPSRGHFLQLGADFGLPSLGSDYSFLRLQLHAQQWWALGWHEGHVFRLDSFFGAVFGDAPLFMRFYVGDLSDFLPDRALDLNFDRRPPPNFLGTNVVEMRYEEFAARIVGEYRIPLYRGHRAIYGIDFFLSGGFFLLGSKRDFDDPARGYSGFSKVPMDLTFNTGIRMQTSAGGFFFAFSNAIGFIPFRSGEHP